MFLVKVRKGFCAAHRLFNPNLSDERNRELYGKCSNPNGHGHNYTLEVAVAGNADPATGMVVNFYTLDCAVEQHILDKVDHKNLNLDVDFMAGIVPTAENLAIKFWEALEPHVAPGRLFSITLSESESNIVAYFGPGGQIPQEAPQRS